MNQERNELSYLFRLANKKEIYYTHCRFAINSDKRGKILSSRSLLLCFLTVFIRIGHVDGRRSFGIRAADVKPPNVKVSPIEKVEDEEQERGAVQKEPVRPRVFVVPSRVMFVQHRLTAVFRRRITARGFARIRISRIPFTGLLQTDDNRR